MHILLRGTFWLGVYLALILAPLFLLRRGSVPAGSGFWVDLSLALGFAGTTMMAVMFVLTARFQRPTAPFGIDLVYYFHRQAAIAASLLVIAHPVILLIAEPAFIGFLDPRTMPWTMWAGVFSFLSMAGVMVTSLWRKRLDISYENWRLSHLALAAVAVALAVAHIVGVGHYSGAPWKRWLWLSIGLTCLAIVLYVRLIRPFRLLRRPYMVQEVLAERGDAWTLVLRPQGHGGFRFLPGQFTWLSLWSSPFAMREHPFSIASSAENLTEVRLTIKELGDFTRRIKEVTPGTRAYLDGPYGTFSIDRSPADGFVFVAGGVGIAPVMCMLRTLADRGDRRPLLLFYAYSTWDRLTFREELLTLGERLDLKLVFALSEPPEGWQGERGFLTPEIFARHLPPDKTRRDYFVCGPTPMIDAVERGLSGQGVPLARIHSELFDLV